MDEIFIQSICIRYENEYAKDRFVVAQQLITSRVIATGDAQSIELQCPQKCFLFAEQVSIIQQN